MCREVQSRGLETISVSEYVPFVSAAGTRIKQRSPGLVSSHFTIRSLLLGVTPTSIAEISDISSNRSIERPFTSATVLMLLRSTNSIRADHHAQGAVECQSLGSSLLRECVYRSSFSMRVRFGPC